MMRGLERCGPWCLLLICWPSFIVAQSVEGLLLGTHDNGGCLGECPYEVVDTLDQYHELPLDWHSPPINWMGNLATAYAFGNSVRQAYVGVVSGQFLEPASAALGVWGRAQLTWHSPVYAFGGHSSPATYTITDSYLEIWGFAEGEAEMEISVALCRGEKLDECTEQTRVRAAIWGAGGTVANNTFRLTLEDAPVKGSYREEVQDCSECTDAEGNPRPYSEWTTIAAIYDFPRYTGDINFYRPTTMVFGEPFRIRYVMMALGASERGSESYGEAFIGDPLDVESGVLLDIGAAHTLLDPQPLVSNQVCNAELTPSAPDERFEVLADGTANDSLTGLNWARCPQGYALDDNGTEDLTDDSCAVVGPTEYSWQAALEEAIAANDQQLAGTSDWRLPNIKELHSLVEFTCQLPALNATIFPEFATDQTWSSTANDVGTAEYLTFDRGIVRSGAQGVPYSARLVRAASDGPPPSDETIFSNGFE